MTNRKFNRMLLKSSIVLWMKTLLWNAGLKEILFESRLLGIMVLELLIKIVPIEDSKPESSSKHVFFWNDFRMLIKFNSWFVYDLVWSLGLSCLLWSLILFSVWFLDFFMKFDFDIFNIVHKFDVTCWSLLLIVLWLIDLGDKIFF